MDRSDTNGDGRELISGTGLVPAPLQSSQTQTAGQPIAEPAPIAPTITPRDINSDFARDRRLVMLSLLALPIGAVGAGVAYALVWLIGVITNLSFYLRWSSAFVS